LRVDFRGLPYRDEQARHNFANTLLSKIQSLPGVRQAAISTGRASTMVVIKEGESMPADRNAHSAMVNSISSDFGQMLGMSIVSGRWLDEVETPGALLVNETLARREFPNGDAVGRRIRLPWVGSERFGTIVGVVSDLKYAVIDADVVPEIFTHHADSPLFGVLMAVRIDGDPMAAAPSIARAVATIDPTQAAFSVRTLEAALDESIAPRRFNLLLLGTFAAVALLLAVLGVYAVIASAVAARRHEIGVRLALGAERRQVFSMVMTDGMRSVLAGLVVGLLGALSAARVMSSLLYGVGAYDAATFVAATMLLAAVAFLACAAPALRAAVFEPATALRAE
jgi:putative ABC transport system permease protein